MSAIEIIPTVVPNSLADVASARERYASFASAIHIDAADGVMAPNTTWTPASGEKLSDADTFMYETHLMVKDPLEAGLAFARAGSKRVVGHLEAFADIDHARDALKKWREAGAKEVGIGVLFQTPLDTLEPHLSFCDCVIMMTIASIGVQGIPFAEGAVERIVEARKRFPDLLIGVDGGVSEKNITALAKAGATRFSVGSAIAKAPDPAAMYQNLMTLAQSAQSAIDTQ